MKQRIRGAAVIVHENSIALAYHTDMHRDLKWWSPPGGGVEGRSESILECAAREALEETSLIVIPERPIYAQEHYSPQRNQRTLELFVLCHLAEGVTPADLKADNEISEARFFDVQTAKDVLILPEVFQTVVWQDLPSGFPEFRYLGMVQV
jgi:8-oxo-dGTP diphosphatase